MLWVVQISAPLCLHGLKATQQELSKSSRLLDLPEHRLHDLLSHGPFIRWTLQQSARSLRSSPRDLRQIQVLARQSDDELRRKLQKRAWSAAAAAKAEAERAAEEKRKRRKAIERTSSPS
jgi:hypothetical protein